MTWHATLMDYNHGKASVLIQTGNGRLYTYTLDGKDLKNNIAEAIAQIVSIPVDRVEFKGEPRRRDNMTVFIYLVMYDEMPTGVDY